MFHLVESQLKEQKQNKGQGKQVSPDVARIIVQPEDSFQNLLRVSSPDLIPCFNIGNMGKRRCLL